MHTSQFVSQGCPRMVWSSILFHTTAKQSKSDPKLRQDQNSKNLMKAHLSDLTNVQTSI
jgi:hypothetical protein